MKSLSTLTPNLRFIRRALNFKGAALLILFWALVLFQGILGGFSFIRWRKFSKRIDLVLSLVELLSFILLLFVGLAGNSLKIFTH